MVSNMESISRDLYLTKTVGGEGEEEEESRDYHHHQRRVGMDARVSGIFSS